MTHPGDDTRLDPASTPLVIGAAGFLGINLVDAFAAEGVRPRCGRRQRTNVIPLRRRGAALVLADLGDPASLDRALDGVDLVFHLAGHYPRDVLTPAASLARALRETSALLEACARARIRRLVYVSSTATVAPRPGGGASTEADRFPSPPRGLYHRIKWHLETLVEAEDRFETVTVCPGACLGPWDLRVGTSAFIVALARGLAPPFPDGVVNLVDARDVATALVRLGRLPAPPPRLILSAHTWRLSALLARLSERYDAPLGTALDPAAAIALADEEERRVHGTPQRAALAREIVDLVLEGVPVDATLAARRLGLSWTPLTETLDAFDAWARRLRIIPDLPSPMAAPGQEPVANR